MRENKIMKRNYFFSRFFRSEARQILPSPENLSTTELEIKIDPLKEAKQPLLTQTNTSLQEIGIESFGDSIENEIRERKKLFDATTPLIFTSIAVFFCEICAYGAYIKFRSNYVKENRQAWQEIGFSEPRIITANQFIAAFFTTQKALEIINSSVSNTLPLDVLEIIIQYLGDPGFNSIQRTKSTSTPNVQPSFFNDINEERKKNPNPASLRTFYEN